MPQIKFATVYTILNKYFCFLICKNDLSLENCRSIRKAFFNTHYRFLHWSYNNRMGSALWIRGRFCEYKQNSFDPIKRFYVNSTMRLQCGKCHSRGIRLKTRGQCNFGETHKCIISESCLWRVCKAPCHAIFIPHLEFGILGFCVPQHLSVFPVRPCRSARSCATQWVDVWCVVGTPSTAIPMHMHRI